MLYTERTCIVFFAAYGLEITTNCLYLFKLDSFSHKMSNEHHVEMSFYLLFSIFTGFEFDTSCNGFKAIYVHLLFDQEEKSNILCFDYFYLNRKLWRAMHNGIIKTAKGIRS